MHYNCHTHMEVELYWFFLFAETILIVIVSIMLGTKTLVLNPDRVK